MAFSTILQLQIDSICLKGGVQFAKDMKFLSIVIWALPLFSLLAGCGAGGQKDREIRGKVSKVYTDEAKIELLTSKGIWGGEEKTVYQVTGGDVAWLKLGREIRGIATKEKEMLKLQQIFPAANKEESRMYVRNQELRSDTVDRGKQAFREVGESLPTFALFDQDGQIWDNESFEGKHTIFTFVFTRCRAPEMCPATTMRMGKMLSEIKKSGLSDAQLISITLDPDYDTPGILKSYAGGFGVDDPQYRFLTGPLQAVHDLKKQLGIITRPDPDMLIHHSMSTALVGPDLKIIYRVPGSKWDVSDFLDKMRIKSQASSTPPSQ